MRLDRLRVSCMSWPEATIIYSIMLMNYVNNADQALIRYFNNFFDLVVTTVGLQYD